MIDFRSDVLLSDRDREDIFDGGILDPGLIEIRGSKVVCDNSGIGDLEGTFITVFLGESFLRRGNEIIDFTDDRNSVTERDSSTDFITEDKGRTSVND